YPTLPHKNAHITIQLSPKPNFNFQLLQLNPQNYHTLKQPHHHPNFNINQTSILLLPDPLATILLHYFK
ncbi:hypothetical protein, partial [Staphylococcus epidermidis]|uniref:hypothetical protein n=1 Tax=Staphylococcus epidermidis TaxID=1282 RepID=UPI001C92DB38